MADKDDILADLRRSQPQQIDNRVKRTAELELPSAKAWKNWSNSSKPPESDIEKPSLRCGFQLLCRVRRFLKGSRNLRVMLILRLTRRIPLFATLSWTRRGKREGE